MTERIIGIDLGTSNSAAAIIQGGKPTIIPAAPPINIIGINVLETLSKKLINMEKLIFVLLNINPANKANTPDINADFAGCNPITNIRNIKLAIGIKCSPLCFIKFLKTGVSFLFKPIRLLSFAIKSTCINKMT